MKTPSWALVGPAEDKHQDLIHRWVVYASVVFESETCHHSYKNS